MQLKSVCCNNICSSFFPQLARRLLLPLLAAAALLMLNFARKMRLKSLLMVSQGKHTDMEGDSKNLSRGRMRIVMEGGFAKMCKRVGEQTYCAYAMLTESLAPLSTAVCCLSSGHSSPDPLSCLSFFPLLSSLSPHNPCLPVSVWSYISLSCSVQVLYGK